MKNKGVEKKVIGRRGTFWGEGNKERGMNNTHKHTEWTDELWSDR